jgi:outer membrane protein OmpA-like peptidoglycan-associated protein
MKIIFSGIFVFLIWSGLSGWFYVCEIRGLCPGNMEAGVSPVPETTGNEAVIAGDTLTMAEVPAPPELVIHFETDSWSVPGDPRTDSICSQYKNWVDNAADALIYINGYTDATGSAEYNMKLGKHRAESVRDYFTSRGIPANKMVITSFGEDKPVGNNATMAGRSENRRAEVTTQN